MTGNDLVVRGSEVEVLDPGEKTLEELAAIANEENYNTRVALCSALDHAVKCGDALMTARDMVGRRKWVGWMDANLNFSRTHACRYMRIAFYRDQIPAEITTSFVDARGSRHEASMNRASIFVKGLPSIRVEGRVKDQTRREIRRLHDEGLAYKDIAELLGLSYPTVKGICEPDWARERNNVAKKRKREATAAKNALAEQKKKNTRSSAAKHAGGALGKTWNLILEATAVADQARLQASDQEVRVAMDLVLTHLYKAEDAIGKALKVP